MTITYLVMFSYFVSCGVASSYRRIILLLKLYDKSILIRFFLFSVRYKFKMLFYLFLEWIKVIGFFDRFLISVLMVRKLI